MRPALRLDAWVGQVVRGRWLGRADVRQLGAFGFLVLKGALLQDQNPLWRAFPHPATVKRAPQEQLLHSATAPQDRSTFPIVGC